MRPAASSREPPGACRTTLMMGVIAAVLRGGLVREDLVEGHVVRIDSVASDNRNDRGTHAQVTDQCSDGDVHDIITEASAVRPAAGNNSAAEAGLDGAGEHVAAEDTQAGVACVALVGRMIRSTARQPAGASGKVD